MKPKESGTALDNFFNAFERFLKDIDTNGGRILILCVLVGAGFVGLARGLFGADKLAVAALVTLLSVLARNPRSPGLVAALLTLLKK